MHLKEGYNQEVLERFKIFLTEFGKAELSQLIVKAVRSSFLSRTDDCNFSYPACAGSFSIPQCLSAGLKPLRDQSKCRTRNQDVANL